MPDDNPVTRRMAGAMHERIDRVEQARRLFVRWWNRTRNRLPGVPRTTLDELTGDTLAEWALANVLHAPKRPVPSFGFGLAPVLTHCVAARRQRRLRCLILPLALGTVALRP